MSTFTRAVVVTVVAVLGASTRAVGDPSRNASTYALLAGSELLATSFEVTSGDVGVNQGRLRVSHGLAATASTVVADTTDLRGSASCTALFSNHALAGGEGCGPAAGYVGPIVPDLGAACGFPAGTFPACDDTAGRTIPVFGSLRLDPGAYGAVRLEGKNRRTGAVLFLRGGVYRFCSLRALHGAQLRFDGPAQVYVRDGIRFDSETFLGPSGPDATPAVAASAIDLFVGGGPVYFSHRSIVRAALCAPSALLRVKNDARLTGTFVADAIRIGRGTTFGAGGPPSSTTTTTPGPSSTSTSTTSTSTSSTTSTTDAFCLDSCGDDVLDAECGEECDGEDLGDAICPGSPNGALVADCPRCTADCKLDASCCPLVVTTTSTVPLQTTTSTTSSTGTIRTTSTSSSTSTSRSTTSSSSTSTSRTTTTSSSTSTTAPGGSCPTRLEFTTTVGTASCGGAAFSPASVAPSSGAIFDAGNAKVGDLGLSCLYVGGGGNTATAPNSNPDGPTSVFSVTSCSGDTLNLAANAGSGPASCTFGTAATKHCTRAPATACTTDADCGAGGSTGLCNPDPRCYFGPPLPIPAGPTSTCVVNVFRADAGGTVDRAAGTSNISLPLASYVFLTGNSTRVCTNFAPGTDGFGVCFNDTHCGGQPGSCQPPPACPRCLPSGSGSKCLGGKRHGQSCTPVGTKLTTLDCPPKDNIFTAPLNVTLAPLATGTSTLTAAANGRFCPTATAGTCSTTADPINCQRTPGCFGRAACRRIQETGIAAGSLTDGQAHPVTIAATFCIPATGNSLIDGGTGADLPGPGAVSIRGTFKTLP